MADNTPYILGTDKGLLIDRMYVPYTHKVYSTEVFVEQAVNLAVTIEFSGQLTVIKEFENIQTTIYETGEAENNVTRLNIPLEAGITRLYVLTYTSEESQVFKCSLDIAAISGTRLPILEDYNGWITIPVGNQAIDLLQSHFFTSTPDQNATWTTTSETAEGRIVLFHVDNTAGVGITFGTGFDVDPILITDTGIQLRLVYYDGTTWREIATGGGGIPGGSDTQVQYNKANIFAGDKGFIYDEGTGKITITNIDITSMSTAGIVKNDKSGNLSGGNSVDISSDTNLAVSDPVSFTGDTVGLKSDSDFIQLDKSGNLQTKGNIRADGSIILTADWDIGDGRQIKADKMIARDGAGISIQEDSGTYGITIEDDGDAIIKIGDKAGARKVTVQDSDGSPVFTIDSDGLLVGTALKTHADGVEVTVDLPMDEVTPRVGMIIAVELGHAGPSAVGQKDGTRRVFYIP